MYEEIVIDTAEQISAEQSGNTLIDATQNVIIDAAENVSQALGITGNNTPIEVHEIPFYADVEFWVGIAFILSVLLLAKPLGKYIKSALQRRIGKVINDIDEAMKLRDDAQQLLAEYEKKFRDAKTLSVEIVERSRRNLQTIKNKELQKLETDLRNKEKEAERRIATATEKAKQEINISASHFSIDFAQKAINNYLQKTDKSRLIDDAIAELDKFIKA